MSRTPCPNSRFGIGSMPHSGMPGPPFGPAFFKHQDMVGRDVEIVAFDLAHHVVIVLEGDHFAAVLEEALVGGRRLDDAALRREVALEHRGRAFGIDRVVERMDDVGDMDLGALDVLADASCR